MDKQDYYVILVDRIKECLSLTNSNRTDSTLSNVITRYASELRDNVETADSDDTIRKFFSNFVNKILSSVEALGLSDVQYKAVRKLILSEIYGCLDIVLNNRKVVKEKK